LKNRQMIPVIMIFKKSNNIPQKLPVWHLSGKEEEKHRICTNQDAAKPEHILTHNR